jgi:hypothetical protein
MRGMMRGIRALWLIGFLAIGGGGVGCATDSRPIARGQGCALATVSDLRRSPEVYTGHIVCVTGFLGQLVEYGEDSPDIYATREQAISRFTDDYVTLGVRFDVQTQKRLYRYSTRRMTVRGRLVVDPLCRSNPSQRGVPKCIPDRPMKIESAQIITVQ